MDYIGATPMQNPIMGLLAERLKKAQEFAAKPFGYSNPPAEMLMNLLGVPAVQQTAERLAYGEPLTTGRGMTTQIRPEAVEAALTVAPTVGLLGKTAERGAMAAGRAGERYAEKVVPQIMERGGLPAQLLGDLSQGSIRPMDVWHGTPHKFDAFDASKIGTGEGAQAFGHGLYLGEARGTGEGYREALSGSGAKLVKAAFNDDPELWVAGQLYSNVKPKDIKEGLSILDYQGNADDLIKSAKSRLNQEKAAGYLYKVDLPDEAIANMLDWDKPVSKQPTVMNALRSEAEQRVRDRKLGEIENEIRESLPKQEIGDDYLSMFSDANAVQNQDIQAQALSKLNKMDLKSLVDKELDSMKPVDMNWNMTGKDFYEILSKREGGAPKASEIMQKQGVPGIRYLDQGSRNYESGTSNFVVFPGNEDLLKIKEINDKPYEQWFPKTNLLETAEPKATQGLLDTSYRGSHTAPGPDFGAPLYDLTGGGQMYPADVYSSKAAQYYGTGYPKADKEAFALANKVRGNPDAEVTMYRAVPKDASIESINKGDWVTLSKDYAKNHGESVLDNNYKIISQKVKAKYLWTNADSIHEFGYWPE